MLKNLPAKTGDLGFNPWSRKIPHAAEQLSLCTATTEPTLDSPGATAREATTTRSLRTTPRESPDRAIKTQRSQKNKKRLGA